MFAYSMSSPVSLVSVLLVLSSVVRGGSSLSGSMRGSVAKVQIAEDFLAGNTQLTYLRLENLNISTSFAKLLANLPTTLQQFGLKNNMVTELPTSITQFKDAVVLYVVAWVASLKQLLDSSSAHRDRHSQL